MRSPCGSCSARRLGRRSPSSHTSLHLRSEAPARFVPKIFYSPSDPLPEVSSAVQDPPLPPVVVVNWASMILLGFLVIREMVYSPFRARIFPALKCPFPNTTSLFGSMHVTVTFVSRPSMEMYALFGQSVVDPMTCHGRPLKSSS